MSCHFSKDKIETNSKILKRYNLIVTWWSIISSYCGVKLELVIVDLSWDSGWTVFGSSEGNREKVGATDEVSVAVISVSGEAGEAEEAGKAEEAEEAETAEEVGEAEEIGDTELIIVRHWTAFVGSK